MGTKIQLNVAVLNLREVQRRCKLPIEALKGGFIGHESAQ